MPNNEPDKPGPAPQGKGLKAQILLFVSEYVVDFNGKQAAIRAGYSPKTAEQQASRLLSQRKVQDAVRAAQSKTLAKNEHQAQRLITELQGLAHSNVLDFVSSDGTIDLTKIPRDKAAAISELVVDQVTKGEGEDAKPVLRVRLKLHAKQPAIDRLGQHYGMWKGERLGDTVNLWNVQVQNNTNVQVRVEQVRSDLQDIFRDAAQLVSAEDAGSGDPVLRPEPDGGRGKRAAPRARGQAVARS